MPLADAERNRERVLAAARRLYAGYGLGVSMACIACEAGVGKATLSRRFATREDLINAVFADRMDAYAAVGAGRRERRGLLVVAVAGGRDVLDGYGPGQPGAVDPHRGGVLVAGLLTSEPAAVDDVALEGLVVREQAVFECTPRPRAHPLSTLMSRETIQRCV
ncbi:helix-turn-helix domain-containing protein [Nonomuraea sp. NPDC023979]|uniref:TetR/AcrR family transcriptional regulator n=1 Tax=Nonomuraea sp. NPDC023979 TaxID=3154796 RepID=UPI0033F4192D